jgi:ATP-dependent 26S proteasome regulatory subunit
MSEKLDLSFVRDGLFGYDVEFEIKNLAVGLVKRAADLNKCMMKFDRVGNLADIKDLQKIIVGTPLTKDAHSTIYTSEETIVDVTFFEHDKYITVHGYTLNKDYFDLVSKIEITPQKTDKKGQIYAITSNGGGLGFTELGMAGIKFNKLNYSNKVVEDYNTVVKDLNANNPAGRISIFEGPPGTGKTHLIKSLLFAAPKAMFVLVPPELITKLSGPEFLPALLRQQSFNTEKGPIVLVLEDADNCLVKRDKENMTSIQALLNLGDGIIGSLLDIRIIATTNATVLDIEPAILRPGRLSCRSEVKHLNQDEARKLWKYLLPDNPPGLTGRDYVLAEVYSEARKAGWEPK